MVALFSILCAFPFSVSYALGYLKVPRGSFNPLIYTLPFHQQYSRVGCMTLIPWQPSAEQSPLHYSADRMVFQENIISAAITR